MCVNAFVCPSSMCVCVYECAQTVFFPVCGYMVLYFVLRGQDHSGSYGTHRAITSFVHARQIHT